MWVQATAFASCEVESSTGTSRICDINYPSNSDFSFHSPITDFKSHFPSVRPWLWPSQMGVNGWSLSSWQLYYEDRRIMFLLKQDIKAGPWTNLICQRLTQPRKKPQLRADRSRWSGRYHDSDHLTSEPSSSYESDCNHTKQHWKEKSFKKNDAFIYPMAAHQNDWALRIRYRCMCLNYIISTIIFFFFLFGLLTWGFIFPYSKSKLIFYTSTFQKY